MGANWRPASVSELTWGARDERRIRGRFRVTARIAGRAPRAERHRLFPTAIAGRYNLAFNERPDRNAKEASHA